MRSDASRLLDAMEAYARLGHTLRFSPLGQDRFWQNLPLTMPQVRALGLIASVGPVGPSGRELAALLGVGPSAITPLVDRLVEHGLVTRQEDPLDRRILRMRATPKGMEMLERLANVRREVLAEIVARIDPADFPVVEHALEILTRAVERLANEQHAEAGRTAATATT